jgi:cytidylate kinase
MKIIANLKKVSRKLCTRNKYHIKRNNNTMKIERNKQEKKKYKKIKTITNKNQKKID